LTPDLLQPASDLERCFDRVFTLVWGA
jgi:hypothetical protein